MEQLVQADIFFFITSIAVVVASIVLTVAFVYVIQILRDIRYITKRTRIEADAILNDVHHARKFVEKEAKRVINVKDIITSVASIVTGSKPKKRVARKKKS